MDARHACPICGHSNVTFFSRVKDYSISQETFSLCNCSSCHFLFTADAPGHAEIGKYYASDAYISHTDSKKGLIENLYQIVRKQTLSGKRKLINQFFNLRKGSILDYGCGTGAFLHEMKSHGWKVDGIEPDEGARRKAEQLNGITIGLPDTLSVLPNASFDIITMWHVLEHVHNLNEVIEQLKQLLTPNGKLIVAVPNYTSQDAAHYGTYWAAYDVPRHLYHFSPFAMECLMKNHGLQIVHKKGMWFDSFYVAMLSEKYKYGKINYLRAFLIGLYANFKAYLNIEKCSSLIYIISK